MLTRGEHLNVIRRAGLRLVSEDGSSSTVTGLKASDDLGEFGEQDVVIIALKAHQIAPMAADLQVLYGADTVVIPVQNGVPWWFFFGFGGDYEGRRIMSLDPEGVLERDIPTWRIVGAIAYPAAERPEPGTVRVVEGDRFPLGELDGTRSDRAETITKVLDTAGFRSRLLRDIRTHLWVKAWGNVAFNPISALTGATMGQILRQPSARALVTTMMEEAAAIAEALGLRLRMTINQRIEGAETVGEHKTSMLQDVEHGRALELEALVGAFVELGEMTSTPTPAINAIYASAKLLDARLTEDRARAES